MTHIALKDFPLSRNGVSIEQVIAGDEVNVQEELISGLLDAGYIATPENVPTPGAGGGEPVQESSSGEPTPGAGAENAGAGEIGAVTETKYASKKGSAAKKDGAE